MKRHHAIAIAVAATAVATAGLLISHPSKIGPPALYPNSLLTPGLIATQSYQELIAVNQCGTYSLCHRQTTSQMKTQVCSEYPQNCTDSHHEIDHVIPLALGGADDVKNLWAQPEHNPWNGTEYGFHVKDQLETYLVDQMKAGKITPKDAQDCILSDWVSCYQKYLGQTLGGVQSSTDPDN